MISLGLIIIFHLLLMPLSERRSDNPAPKPPDGFFNREAANRGKEVINGKATCARCHVLPFRRAQLAFTPS